MLRLGRLTDYAIVLATALAKLEGDSAAARALAQRTGIPLPTVVKLLKVMTAGGLTRSVQGRRGGYTLARPAAEIGLAEIIETLEGPVALTECSREPGRCGIQDSCATHRHWLVINRSVRKALAGIRLADLATPAESLRGLGSSNAGMVFSDSFFPG